jgi:hypothetical protein
MMAEASDGKLPLYWMNFTKLSEAQISAALKPVAAKGPTSASPMADLDGAAMQLVLDKGPSLSYMFGKKGQLSLIENGAKPVKAGYGALKHAHFTLFSHLLPDSMRGYTVLVDNHTHLATVIETWFAGFEDKREVMREIYYGYIQEPGKIAPTARHTSNNRFEGKAYYWERDTGARTLDYYCSIAYTHFVPLNGYAKAMGYSAPADYIQIDDDYYLYTRTLCEFSGEFVTYLVDLNRNRQIGMAIGFNEKDALEYYMFTGKGEWLGQIATFERLGDIRGGPMRPNPNSTGQAGAAPANAKGARAVYRPVRTFTKLTRAEVAKVVAESTKTFAPRVGAGSGAAGMAGNALPPGDGLVGKTFTLRYDGGPVMDYRVATAESLEYRRNGGAWVQQRYRCWETMPGVMFFGHALAGMPDFDGHIVVADFENGCVTCYNGYLNGPYIANDAQARTLFGKIEAAGVPDPGSKRHERTLDMVGRCITYNYSQLPNPLTSMHLYSTPGTVSWIIFTADGQMGLQWSGPGDFVKIRDGLYFNYWLETACNGTLGTILINMRTMHDAGIGYHCGKEGLSISQVGAHIRHAGKFDVERFFKQA